MEKELEVVEISNKEYYIIKKIKHGDNVYFYLSNVVDDSDMLIRKANIQDEDLLLPLKDKNEFDMACTLIFSNLKRA